MDAGPRIPSGGRTRIAVTGASGFLGRHVLAELQAHEVEVVAVTRSAARLSDLAGSVQVVQMDIAEAGSDCYERLGRPDVLLHLAWEGLPNYKALRHFETELPRQYGFIKRVVEGGLPALAVSGTCFEYGMQGGLLSEEEVPQPANPYGYAKDALRRQIGFLRDSHPFHLVWARLFYLYGTGQPAGSLFSQLKAAVARQDPSFDMSGGEQLRDFLPVEEAARLLTQLALHHGNAGIVNVCSGQAIPVRTQVQRWLDEYGWRIHLNFGQLPYPDYEPMSLVGDRHRLDSLLGLP